MTNSTLPEVNVPKGFSTYLGVYGTSVLGIIALGSAVANGDHTVETLTALGGAVVLLSTTIYGRMLQAAAAYRAAPGLAGAGDAIDVVNAPLPLDR